MCKGVAEFVISNSCGLLYWMHSTIAFLYLNYKLLFEFQRSFCYLLYIGVTTFRELADKTQLRGSDQLM